MKVIFYFLFFISTLFSSNFETFLKGLKKESISKKILSKKEANRYFSGIKYLKKVILSNKSQTHKKYTFQDYMKKVVSKTRIKKAKENKKLHFKLLQKIEDKYKVNKEVIISLWGIETFFGKYTGKKNILDALSTLAYSDKKIKRRVFFRKEFFIALEILKQQKINKADFKGSWAGAMGQCQFMPSSYKSYAQDFNKDGRADIWHTKDDVFASIANYLKKNKYKYNEPINYEIKKDNFHLIKNIKDKKNISYFRKIGLNIPKSINSNLKAKVIHIKNSDYKNGSFILAFDNYFVIRKWNTPIFFITSVSKLSQNI
jgi:membrane-bound lytic murein transglycosylase B